MRAAVAEYAAYGRAGFSLNGVARRAGVGKSSIYLRWQDKERLLADAVASSVVEPDPEDTGSFAGDLSALMVGLLQSWSQPATLVRHRLALDALPAAPDGGPAEAAPPVGATVDPAPVEAIDLIRRRALERGEPVGLSTDLLGDLVHGSLMLLVLRRAVPQDADEDELAALVAPYLTAVLAAAAD
ncbi:TetR/AcrR family transcriptional regulator [Nocardioides bruguierae]|nr:TetR/AcrR family transcriptional regulator [Nocardioides bruguierae]